MNIILKYIANTIGDKTEPCLIPYLIPLPRTLFFHRRSLLRLFAELRKNYSADFHEIWWKGDTWATEEAVRFWLLIRFCGGGHCYSPQSTWEDVLLGVGLIITILRHRRPWLVYALY